MTGDPREAPRGEVGSWGQGAAAGGRSEAVRPRLFCWTTSS